MKNIKLLKIKLNDFANWKKCEIDFTTNKNLKAPFGYGKTTIYNAFIWCLGLDLETNIKPTNVELDLPKEITSSVIVELVVDDFEYILERNSNNKFEINGNKITTLKKYVENVNEILGLDNEKVSLLVKSGKFNQDTSKWKWNNRRDFLYELFNVKCQLESLQKVYTDLEYEFTHLKENEIENSFTNSLKQYNKDKVNLNKELENKLESLQSYSKEKESELKSEISKLQEEIMLSSETDKQFEISKLENELKELVQNNTTILNNLQKEISEKSTRIYNLTETLHTKINDNEKDIEVYKANAIKISNQAKKVLEREFVAKEVCEYCGSKIELDTDTLKTNQVAFENAKMTEFNGLKNEFERLRQSFLDLENENLKIHTEYTRLIENLKVEKEKLETRYNNFKVKYEQIYNNKSNELFILKENNPTKLNELQARLINLNYELGKYNGRAIIENDIKTLKEKIREIITKEQLVAKKKNDYYEYLSKAKTIVENAINGTLNGNIKFKLFNEKKDGTFENECITLYNGKEYSDISFGEKIYTDLQLTLYLQNAFEINLPIFVDNANAFKTIETVEGKQIISLITTIDGTNNFNGIRVNEFYGRKE